MKLFLLTLYVCLVLAVPSNAYPEVLTCSLDLSTRYVAPGGSDKNFGSEAHPWATIQHAANVVRPGQTVIIEDGTYRETVAITHSGTESCRISFRAKHKWRAKIAPVSTESNNGHVVYIAHASYVTLQGFEIIGTPTSAVGVKFDSGTHNVLLGNNIHNVGVNNQRCISGAGILIADDYETIDSNQIWAIGPPRTAAFRCNQQHGIYITAGRRGVLQNNLIFGVWQGVGIHMHGANLSYWTVTNNTIFNVGDNSHNTGGPMILSCENGQCDHNHFANNIFANTEGGYCWWESQEAGATVGRHNMYENNLTYRCGSAIWVTGSARNSITLAPQFAKYTGDESGDYSLQPTSPAIGRGIRAGAPPHDFNGVSRDPASPIDIGAFQHRER